jgi:hypothetical protein
MIRIIPSRALHGWCHLHHDRSHWQTVCQKASTLVTVLEMVMGQVVLRGPSTAPSTIVLIIVPTGQTRAQK